MILLYCCLPPSVQENFLRKGFVRGYKRRVKSGTLVSVSSYVNKSQKHSFEKVKQDIGRLYDKKDTETGPYSWKDYALVSPQLAKKIKEITGLDVSNYVHSITTDGIKHADKTHGVGNEKDPKQIPIIKEDFLLIPDVIRTPDSISISKEKTKGTHLHAIRFGKKFGDTIYVVEEIRAGRKKLAFKTMYKVKAAQ